MKEKSSLRVYQLVILVLIIALGITGYFLYSYHSYSKGMDDLHASDIANLKAKTKDIADLYSDIGHYRDQISQLEDEKRSLEYKIGVRTDLLYHGDLSFDNLLDLRDDLDSFDLGGLRKGTSEFETDLDAEGFPYSTEAIAIHLLNMEYVERGMVIIYHMPNGGFEILREGMKIENDVYADEIDGYSVYRVSTPDAKVGYLFQIEDYAFMIIGNDTYKTAIQSIAQQYIERYR